MKRCPRCQKVKPCSNFYRNRSTADGFSAYCKTCERIVKHATPSGKYWNTKYQAQRRGISFTIEREEFFNWYKNQSMVCTYCGIELGPKNIPTIDRINDNRGYELENIALSCYHCNMAKGNKSYETWLGILAHGIMINRFSTKIIHRLAKEECTLPVIAKECGFVHSTMGKWLKGLVEKRIISFRTSEKNRRLRYYHLSKLGQAIYHRFHFHTGFVSHNWKNYTYWPIEDFTRFQAIQNHNPKFV